LSEIAIAFEAGAWNTPMATAGLLSRSERSGVFGCAQFDPRNVAQPRDLAVGPGLDNDVGELLLALQPPLWR